MRLRKIRRTLALLALGLFIVGQASAFEVSGDPSGWNYSWGSFKEALCDYFGFPGLCDGGGE